MIHKLYSFWNDNFVLAQMCMLCIALIRIPHRRTYMQWVCYGLYASKLHTACLTNYYLPLQHLKSIIFDKWHSQQCQRFYELAFEFWIFTAKYQLMLFTWTCIFNLTRTLIKFRLYKSLQHNVKSSLVTCLVYKHP